MSGPAFWATIMGRTLIERDVPRVAVALERIASALEVIATRLPQPAPDLTAPKPKETNR